MSARVHAAALAALALVLIVAGARPAVATQKWGPVQFSGNLQSQNLIRHPDADDFQYIQNRNVLRLKLEYKWLQGGKFYDKYDIPFIESSNLFVLYRGVYDSIYDHTPGFIEKEDLHGKVYGFEGENIFDFARDLEDGVRQSAIAAGDRERARRLRGFARRTLTVGGLSNDARDALKFDNQLREIYVDIKMRGIPLSIRAGRQQVVWGETDNFRMLDRVNPLDLTWHFQQEFPAPAFGWDEIRRPMWLLKFLYDTGDMWKFSQTFLEWYWNPGDWRPAKVDFLPRPWAFRFLDPLKNPIDGAFIGGVCATSPVIIQGGINAGQRTCTRLMNNTKLFQQGDYNRNPMENSQVGVRYHAMTPMGLEFTLNYLYQRWAGDDGTNYAPIRGLEVTGNPNADNLRFQQLISQGIFPAEAIHPYVHTPGISANYSDEAYTQAVFRFESIYDIGIPFFDLAKVTLVSNPSLPGVTKKNMWKGMMGFDRPTWIKSVNKKTTIFFTGQFFWHYIVNHPDCEPQTVAQLDSAVRPRVGSCLVGGLDLPSLRRPSAVSFRDKIREWETLFTLAGFTFYRGGSIVPLLGIAVDPVNQFSMEPFWMFDYVIRDDFVVNIAQRYMVTPRGHHTPIFETWGLAGLNTGRSETSIRLSYQF
jgi:hypothetical protein